MIRSLSLFDLAFLGGKFLPEVTDWADRVEANGGAAVSFETKSAASVFVQDLKNAGLWTKFFILNFIAPDNLTAALTPLLKGAGTDPWTNYNFVAADLSTAGLAGNGTNKYLDTGADVSTFLSRNSFGMTTLRSNVSYPGVTGMSISGVYRASGQWTMTELMSGTSELMQAYVGVANPQAVEILGNYGYASMNRVDLTHIYVYEASNEYAHKLTMSNEANFASELAAGNATVFATRNADASTIINYSNRKLSFLAFHTPFSITQSAAFQLILEDLRTALGGGGVAELAPAADDFESYSAGANINGLNAGSRFTTAWVGN